MLPTLPVVAWMFDRATHRRDSRRGLWTYLVLFGLGIVAVAVLSKLSDAEGFSLTRAASVGESAKTILLAAGRYVDQYVLPTRLSPWTPPLENVPWNDTRVFLAALKIAAMLIAAVALRRRAPVVAAGLGAFLLLLSPFLAAALARRLFVADRYMYLPMIGLHLVVASCVVWIVEQIAGRAADHQFVTAANCIGCGH